MPEVFTKDDQDLCATVKKVIDLINVIDQENGLLSICQTLIVTWEKAKKDRGRINVII